MKKLLLITLCLVMAVCMLAGCGTEKTKLTILDTEYAVEDYAICFAKDSELTAQVNTALEELIADGTVQAIIDKYISAE